MTTWQRNIALSDIIDTDLEGFLDLLADLVDNPLLMDISYRLVGVADNGEAIIEITGDDSERDVL